MNAIDAPLRPASPFAIADPGDVLGVLRAILHRRPLLTLVPEGSGDPIVTVLLALDRAGLVLDAARKPADDLRLERAGAVRVEGRDGDVPIAFRIGPLAKRRHDGRPAWHAPLPDVLHRFQRRDHFRIHVPMQRPVLCSVGTTPDGLPVPARIVDLSCGGLSLAGDRSLRGWTPGDVRRGCRLRFPRVRAIEVDVEVVRAFRDPRQRDPSIGCRFVTLPPAALQVVRRYVDDVQRDLRRHV